GTDMPRVFVSATIFMIVLGLAELPARAQISSDATSKSLRVAQNLSPTQQEEQRAGKPLSKAEQVALKQAIKDSPNIDIIRALKDHPDMKGLPTEEAPGL